jgi:predicted permease
VGTLALGVGGAAAIAGVARGLLLDPLPYRQEEHLGLFWSVYDWSESEFLTLEREFPGFERVAAYHPLAVTLELPDAPTRLLPGLEASAELFDVLGTVPLVGPGFQAGDDLEGAEPVAVVSYGLWRELGGDLGIVGQRLTLNGERRTVVGVMPRGFWFPEPEYGVWLARPLDPEDRSGNYALVGRLAAGVTFGALPGYLAQTTARLAESFQYPEEWDKTKNAAVTPLRDVLIGPLRPALWATASAMALILVIACANVAALALGQLEGRSRELAVRVALGAERGRLARQIVIESLWLGSAAALAGSGLAAAGFRVLVAALPLGAWGGNARIDGALFGAAFGAAFLAGLLVALPPLVSLWRGDRRGLAAGERTAGIGVRGGRIEGTLVVAEVALAVLIAAGAALLGRSVSNLYSIDPGVETREIAVLDVVLPGDADHARRQRWIHELRDGLAVVPGVRSVAASHKLPLRGPGSSSGVAVEGRPAEERTTTHFRMVTPGYFETLGYPLIAGRTLTEADGAAARFGEGDDETPVVVNQALVARYFPGENPLGRVLTGGFGARERIVGVVGDAKEASLTDPVAPARYWLTDEARWGLESVSFALRMAPGVDPVSALEPGRDVVTRLARGAAVAQATTMGRLFDQAVGPARQMMRLLTLLTALAVALGGIGVYGVLAHFVGRRRRDWAIRMALGFEPVQVILYVVRRGALLIAAGVGLGWGLALGLSRLLRSLLYGVAPTDPLSMALAGAALVIVGLGAALVPARRASRTQPAHLLREA